MTAPLMKSISGIRGIVGKSFTPELINSVGSAFARYVKKGYVVVGRDSRSSGEAISSGLTSALMLSGCDVIDVGVVPTPTVQLMVEECRAAGGIVISASHNPIQWNAFKLINEQGTFLNKKEIERFFAMMDKPGAYVTWDGVGAVARDETAGMKHIERVRDVIDTRKISRKKFTVALDSVNGAGSHITRALLEGLGCRVIPVNCDGNGIFTRGAEPTADNLTDLVEAVRSSGADIGFAQDPDADRLALVDETGCTLGEEYTITMVTEHMLSREPGRVVVNLSTTSAVEEVARRHGADFTRTPVGEIHVVEEMRKKGARIGGEGNGGVISPEIHLGRDSLAGIGYLLEMMAERKMPISLIRGTLPDYVMKKGKVKVEGIYETSSMLDILARENRDAGSDRRDGLRLDFTGNHRFSGGWVHLRASNTEPIFRIIAEAPEEKMTRAIFSHFSKRVKELSRNS
jgi:phosphomannomutase